jgi:ferredoxin-NADP reductase
VKPSGFVPTPVLAIFGETEDIRTFRLARPEGFEFQSGQFLTVAVQVGGQRLARCYSISSAPETRGYLEISVKRQGLVSGALHSTVRVGSQLPVRPPAGRFVYPVGDDRPLVLLGGGVGCTPLMSMLRHAVACEPSRPVTYLLSAKTERDIAFRQELSLLARRHPQVQIAVALTRASGNGPGFHVGRIDEPLVRRTVTDPQSALFYVCGPLPMIDAMKTLLRGMGVPDAQIHFEAFGAAVAAAASASAIPASAPQRRPARLASVGRAGFALCLARSGRTTTIGKGQTLLEAAEAAQIEIPSSCRAGICGTCRTRLIEGEVDCDGDALDPADREKGYVLACVAMARTDCAIEA